jgi:hypothetical protein
MIQTRSGRAPAVATRLRGTAEWINVSSTPDLLVARLSRQTLIVATADRDVARVSLDAPVLGLSKTSTTSTTSTTTTTLVNQPLLETLGLVTTGGTGYYPAPIFAIAGNHDSSPSSPDRPGDLDQFTKLFCDNTPKPLAADFDRTSMIQPYIYFTLEAPYVKIIGLYSNNGEGPGVLDPAGNQAQLSFLEAEFKRAAKARPADSRAVLVAVHHPLFSIGKDHGSSPTMLDKVDKLMDKTGFIPDAFLSGHVHGFELFVRERKGREIPYIICGTGGYNDDAHVKETLRLPAQFANGFSLAQFFDFQYGFMRVTVDANWLTGEYVGVAKRTTNALPQTSVLESFNLDLKKHEVSSF